MSSDVVIEVKNLAKGFSFGHKSGWSLLGRSSNKPVNTAEAQYWALTDVNFQVRKGEAVGVIGRNGAGKSTLLQLLTGVLEPTSGTVNVSGRVGALLELGAGFNPELTGRENIHLSGAVLGMSAAEVASRIDAIEAFADIGEYIDHPVKTYSSGMLVRLAFSVQVHMEPDILIVDEALSVGDMFFQQKCMSKIREIIGSGVTLFFVSHSINAVKSICQRAIFLEHGKLVADGSAEDVCEAYQNSMSSSSELDLATALSHAQLAVSDHVTMEVQADMQAPLSAIEDFSSRLTNRSGGGEVRFTGFSVLGEGGQVCQSLDRAGRVHLCLQFEAMKNIPEGACVGLLMRDAHGVDIVAFNSNFYGKLLPSLVAGRTYVLDLLVDFPYARGRYSFHCGIKPAVDSSYFYDRCFNIGVVDVESNPLSWGEYGGRVIQVPRSMSLHAV